MMPAGDSAWVRAYATLYTSYSTSHTDNKIRVRVELCFSSANQTENSDYLCIYDKMETTKGLNSNITVFGFIDVVK